MKKQRFPSVLYVDDDPDLCAIVQVALRLLAGLDVRTASSGESAIDLAYEIRPDLIVLDVMMPGLDGPETLKRMRQSALIARIPVIFLTARSQPAEVAQLMESGAIGVITKPFDPLTLGDQVLALWEGAEIVPGVAHPQGAATGVQGVQATVDGLSKTFLRRSVGDVACLREMAGRVSLGDSGALLEIGRMAHSIHGSGAIFGFSDISASGGVLERLVDKFTAETRAPGPMGNPHVLRQLLCCTDEVARAVDAARDIAARRDDVHAHAGRLG
jgi:two-component system, OmpR family, response regulator